MSFPGIDYFNWEKIMHNSAHVSGLPRNLFPNDEPGSRCRAVVNQRQRVDAGPDKYDNRRGAPAERTRLERGAVRLRAREEEGRAAGDRFHGNPPFPLTGSALT